MGEVLGSRVVLRSGDEVFTTWQPGDVLDQVSATAGVWGGRFMAVPLLSMDEDEPRGVCLIRGEAVDAVEPLDEREVEAHRRDREEWIEHG
jgi:hypothetical protein